VRWQKILKLGVGDSPIRPNLQEFVGNKNPEDLVFDGITSSHVNKFLGKAARGLTAKVFRTHHATETVQTYLGRHNGFKPNDPGFVKLYHARVANLEAAIRCNHKRTPPKTWEGTLDKKQAQLADLKKRTTKTDKQAQRLDERMKKLKLNIDLQKRTRDYNLNTSLRNYIDPRVYKNWANKAEFDWTSIYPKTLQRKFLWASKSRAE
jgi:DNA topoisomerase-1